METIKTAKMEICLDGLRFFAYHGVFEQERICGNEFWVDLKVEYECQLEEFTTVKENLDRSISYADLYQIVEEEMNKPRQLLETLACETAKRILQAYPKITKGSLKITKNIPPIGSIDGRSAIKLNF